jgi:hypothetical protein
VVAFSFFALLLVAVPVVVLAMLAVVLALASRHTRVAGLAMLAIIAVLLVGGVGLLLLTRLAHAGYRVEGYADARSSEPTTGTDEWVSVEKGVVPLATIGEDEPAPTDDASGDVKRDATAAPDGSTVDETGREGPVAAVSTPVGSDSSSPAADHRPTVRDRADVPEIKPDSDEVVSRTGIASEVDTLSPGEAPVSEPPDWLNWAEKHEDGVDYRPVSSGPYATRDECRRALAEAMKRAVDEYVDEHRGRPGAADYVDFDLAYIKTHLRHSDVYQEQVQASFGPMIQQHALLEFGQDFREEIERRWKQVRVTSRLALVSLVAVAILAGLATVYAYLRLDTATRGYYSGRLQIAAGAVILGLVALGVLMARWIPWL